MSAQRRDFLKQLFAAGALPGLFSRPGTLGALLDPQAAKQLNLDYDSEAHDFWSGFTAKNGKSAIVGTGQVRGAKTDYSQPVFLHHGDDGFKNAALLDQGKLIEDGDVMVSVNTSVVKVGEDDQKTFEKLQNAQLRVDLAQKTSLMPLLEAMAYTVVGGMHSLQTAEKAAKPAAKTKSAASSGKKSTSSSTVQNISISSDAAW